MTQSQKLIELSETYGAHNYHPLPVVIDRAEGVWVYDPEGNRYLDMLSSYSALNQGHRHPRIISALKNQADKVTLTSRAFHNSEIGPFLKELADICGMEMVLPMNTGAEAVETAIKAARKWGHEIKGIPDGAQEIICCTDNFHGRTTTIISFSTDEQYRYGFGPLTPGFKIIPYGDAEALEAAITPNTAAFLFEPIQGEAGVVIPPDGFLKKCHQICHAREVLFMADEIQTGLGRTGKMFAIEHEGVKPDIFILGKALGAGVLPVSAVVGSSEILGVFRPGDHGSTFGGNPLACAVAREALKVLADEDLVDKAKTLGDYFIKMLQKIKSPHIELIRGRGLLIGVVLKPEAGGARRFCEALKACGLLCKETHQHVIRFAPPLTISKDEIDWSLEHIQEVLAQE